MRLSSRGASRSAARASTPGASDCVKPEVQGQDAQAGEAFEGRKGACAWAPDGIPRQPEGECVEARGMLEGGQARGAIHAHLTRVQVDGQRVEGGGRP